MYVNISDTHFLSASSTTILVQS